MAGIPALVFVFALLAAGLRAEPDPCVDGNYEELDDWQRSTGYVVSGHSHGKCDHSLRADWYRFTSVVGGVMPETPPDRNHCGTPGPIWMNGSHPLVAEGLIAREACVNSGGPGWKAEHGCAHSVHIGVKNCGTFFVYYLQPPPICPIAYCAGDGTKCPPGTASATGFTPCGKIPDPAHVVLSNPHVTAGSFHFTCDVIPPSPRDYNTVFEAEFLFDKQTDPNVPVLTIQGSNTQAVLDGKALKNHMGSNVSCRVRSHLANQPFLVWNNWTNSNSYWAGMKTTPHVICSEKGGGVNVTVTSTVPVMCQNKPSCCIRIPFDADGPKDNLVTSSPCEHQLCSHHWDHQTSSASVNIQVSAAKDNVKDGDNVNTLRFDHLDAEPGEPYTEIFTGYRPPNSTVSVQDGKVHICTWTGDPHFNDFQGRRFNIYDAGDFTVYENKEENFELHARFMKCGSHAACQCGLAIHEQNDVIKIDSCHNVNHAPAVRTNGQLRQGTKIERSSDGRHIIVYLPSGREIKVDAGYSYHSHYHNVYLSVPASDAGNGRGICGSIGSSERVTSFQHRDGVHRSSCHSSHCFPHSFTNSWRNKPAVSLFEMVPPLVNETRDSAFCKCDQGNHATLLRTNCTRTPVTHLAQRCSGGSCHDVTNKLPPILQGFGGWTRRGARYEDVDEPEQPVNLTAPTSSDSAIAAFFPTPSGITEAQAKEACNNASKNSQLFHQCKHDVGREVTGAILDDCVQDVMLLDSLEMVEAATQAMTSVCQFQLLQNVSNYVTAPDGSLVAKPELSQDTCSESCMQHGTCNKGTCVCNPGFAGDNCQLKANTPPTLVRLRGPGECDVQQRPCRKVWLDADHFQVTPNFRCRVTASKQNGSVIFTKDEVAEFISGGRLACGLPDVTSHSATELKIAVTMDGLHFSNRAALTVFDSACMSCSSGICQQKPDTCLIDDKCYQNNDNKPDDKTKFCNASTSATEWSSVPTAHNYPELQGVPVVTGPDSDFLVHCNVRAALPDSRARFRVTWYTEGHVQVGGAVLTAGQLSVDFSVLSLPSTASKIYCTVQSFYVDQSSQSPILGSEPMAVEI